MFKHALKLRGETMFQSIYREGFEGIGVGRVARDQNFNADLGFFKNEYQIHYMFSGERYFFCDGCCYKMEPGSIALVDKGMIPKTCILGGSYHDRLLIELAGAYFAPACGLLGMDFPGFFASHCGVYGAAENEWVRDFFREFEELARDKTIPNREFQIKAMVLELLGKSWIWEGGRVRRYEASGVRSSLLKQKRVYEIVDYIGEHCTESCTVEELSRHFFMSKSYLCRIFKEITNFTVSEYLNLCRVAASKEYLVNSGYSMTEIANRLGYESLTYFERVFKGAMSVTPLQYRRMYAERRGRGGGTAHGKEAGE